MEPGETEQGGEFDEDQARRNRQNSGTLWPVDLVPVNVESVSVEPVVDGVRGLGLKVYDAATSLVHEIPGADTALQLGQGFAERVVSVAERAEVPMRTAEFVASALDASGAILEGTADVAQAVGEGVVVVVEVVGGILGGLSS